MASITQYGKLATERLATATRNGMLAAADFTKLQLLRWGGAGNRRLLLPPDYTSFVAAESGNGTAHLRAQLSNAFVEAAGSLHLADNLYYDGTNWQRFSTTLPGHILVMDSGNYYLYTAAAGANPATITLVGSFTPAQLALSLNPPRGHVYGNGTAQSVNNATVTPVLFNAAITNSAGASGGAVPWSAGSPGRLVAPATGMYELGGCVVYNTAAGGAQRGAFLRVNGAALMGGNFAPPSASQFVRVTAHTIRSLNATDYVELCAYQDSGGTISVIGNGEEEAFYMQYIGVS